MRGRGDNLTARTWIWWEVETGDDEVSITMEARVRWTFSAPVPAQLSGPPESCYPAEGGEVLECQIAEIYDHATDETTAVNIDGEEFMREHGIDFERETERAWVKAECVNDEP